MEKPFIVSIPTTVLEDLRRRLDATRWPPGLVESGGVPLSQLRELIDYWRDEFSWERAETSLRERSHFKTTIEGQGVHFIHERAENARFPILMLHGWPGSFVEMLSVTTILRKEMDIVVPSLPGYGFSEPPVSPGMSNERMADLFVELMSSLGYERFVVQGGDWGAGIATWIARKHPQRLAGMHLNYIPGSYSPFVRGDLTSEEAEFVGQSAEWVTESGAYGAIQRTRPLTVAYGLSDSPVGLAAWIWEKFQEWADPSSEISRDDLLTNITLYWVTNTIGSSMRLYLESARTPLRFEDGERIGVPCAVAHFPFEAPFPPRSWIERVYNVTRWSEMPRGGHFAALEAPDLLAADILEFARSLES